MTITVKFVTSGRGNPINVSSSQITLRDMLDQGLDLEECKLAYSWVDSKFSSPIIEIPLELCLALGIYESQQVEVPDEGLNKYLMLARTTNSNGDRPRPMFQWELKNWIVLVDWINAGCPNEWDPADPPPEPTKRTMKRDEKGHFVKK